MLNIYIYFCRRINKILENNNFRNFFYTLCTYVFVNIGRQILVSKTVTVVKFEVIANYLSVIHILLIFPCRFKSTVANIMRYPKSIFKYFLQYMIYSIYYITFVHFYKIFLPLLQKLGNFDYYIENVIKLVQIE